MWLACIALNKPAQGQLLIPEVTIDFKGLPQEAQAKLAGLDSAVIQYLRGQQWAGDDYQYDFPIQIAIYFTPNEYSPNPQEDKFKAKLIVSNKKDARLEDTRWEFGLRQPYMFRPNQYHPFMGVIEFYVWLLYGLEFDKLEKLGGRPWYDKARTVYLTSINSQYMLGWDKRKDLLDAQVDKRNDTSRSLNFYYYTGIYYDIKEKYADAKDYLYWALVYLEKVPEEVQTRFLDINRDDFARALIRADYAKGIKALEKLDPSHKSIYEAIAPQGGNNK
jgi:hypothetical protein